MYRLLHCILLVIPLAITSLAMGQGKSAKQLLLIPDRCVVLTFDDANKSDRTVVAETLKKYEFGATFYVTEGLGFLNSKENYTTWKEIRELHDLGFEIGNHTQHHRNVARLSHEDLTASLQHIDARCKEHGIAKPTTFCYPGFSHSLGAVRTLEKRGFQFARRGVGPEFRDGGKGGRGPAYDPAVDHPLLIPTTGYAGPQWSFDDLKWAVEQAQGGKICVLCFHGIPSVEHSWVSTKPADFERYMRFLKDEACTVIAMRDLVNYVDPANRPADPYAPIKRRMETPVQISASRIDNPLGLDLAEYEFGWQPATKPSRQAAYQILVASDQNKLNVNVGDLWDSRRIDSPTTSARYFGEPLPRGASVFWKVRTWNDQGEAGPFSAAAKIDVPPVKPIVRKRRQDAAESTLRFIEGRHGKSLSFDDKTPMVKLPNYPMSEAAAGLTIGAWIRPSRTPDAWQTIFRKEDGDQRRLLAIGRTRETWGLWFGLGVSGRYVEVGAPVASERLGDGKWHHVAGTFDGKVISVYVDGERVGGSTLAGRLDAGFTAPTFIGAYGDRQEPFHGQIDEVRIDHRALSAEELKQIAEGKTDVAHDALAGQWKLDGQLTNEVAQPAAAVPPARVVVIGNTLIANMNHHGFLETALTVHWPRHDITFRNLGWPADDVFGTARSEFGSDHNTRSWKPPSAEHGFGFRTLLEQVDDAQPSTLIVGYGTETAFYETDEEFERFQKGYIQLLDALEASGAALVLLGPPRQEHVGSSLPDPAERNKRLQATNEFISEVAKKRGCRFIGLFDRLIPEEATTPSYTDNGIHLNERGYRRMAHLVMEKLGLATAPAYRIVLSNSGDVVSATGGRIDRLTKNERGARFDFVSDLLHVGSVQIANAAMAQRLKIDGATNVEAGADELKRGVTPLASPNFKQSERLRQTIIEKNKLAGYRLRPLNKAYIFLFRRHEMGHLAHELRDFDRLVGEQEELIARLRLPRTHRYAIEQIDDWKPPRAYPDHEVPKEIPKPDIDAELAAFTVAEGFEVNIFAANPMIANPINLNWDTRGRAWVSTSSTYPHIKPGREPNDRIVILEDTDQDGRADKSAVFAEGLQVPHSVMPVQGGAYICSTTELLFLADHDSDDRADDRRVVYSGFGNADVHHMIHGLRWAPWGELYFTQSIYINSFVETPWGNRRLNGSGIWRFRPESERLEIFARGMVNPWGHAFDAWGQSFATDGAGGAGPHYVFNGAAFPSAVGADRILHGLIPGKPKNTAAEFVSGQHMPQRWHDSLLANDFRANRTVRYEIKERDSGYAAAEVETVLHSSHRSFRPVDIKMGPDGALYIVDWYNPIIDHGEVDFHHPQRDKTHGRIWRLTAKGQPLLKKPQIHGAEIDDLLELLKAPEEWTRVQAKRELTGRPPERVVAALHKWTAALDAGDPNAGRHRSEALWLHGAVQAPNAELLTQVLSSGDHRERAAGVRMVSLWYSDLPDALAMLSGAVEDDHPRVRLEAVNALRQVGTLEAANLALRALYFPVDENLDYALWLTARQTQDTWLPALQAGKTVFDGKVERIAFALSASTDRDAMQPLVALVREGRVAGDNRTSVLRTIAGLGGPDELRVVLEIAAEEPTLLRAVADGALANHSVPSDATKVTSFLDHDNAQVRSAAAELVGQWKVASATAGLVTLAGGDEGAFEDRLAATTALARIGEFDSLQEMSTAKSLPVRTAAIAAWASAKPDSAADPAARLLGEFRSPEEAAPIYDAFVARKDGPHALAKAIAAKKIQPAVAAAGIHISQASGRDLSALIDVLTESGSLESVASQLTAEARRQLLSDAENFGDTARGEKVFRREELACAKCHAVGDTGGKLGPDLTSVGAYMTADSLLESVLNPSSAIKQGYETVIVVRKSGFIVSGTLQRRTDTSVLIRDQNGKVVSVPNDDIDSLDTSPISLMPQGLSQKLRRDELVDLMRYLTSRGKQPD